MCMRFTYALFVDQENSTGLLAGSLSTFDLKRGYKTDASHKFKPYIVDPEATGSKTDRYLRNRYGTTFSSSSLECPIIRGSLNAADGLISGMCPALSSFNPVYVTSLLHASFHLGFGCLLLIFPGIALHLLLSSHMIIQ